jgi:hypothetical protein
VWCRSVAGTATGASRHGLGEAGGVRWDAPPQSDPTDGRRRRPFAAQVRMAQERAGGWRGHPAAARVLARGALSGAAADLLDRLLERDEVGFKVRGLG